MKKLFTRKSLFAVPLVVLFLTFLYPQTGRADCPDDWWCDPGPEVVNNPFDPWSYSPGFSLHVCYDPACAAALGPSSGLPDPNVKIKSSNGCTTPTDVTITGNAICAAGNGTVDPSSIAECEVSIKVLAAECTVVGGSASYSRSQTDGQVPGTVYDPLSKITIKGRTGLTGWPPCDGDELEGDCTADFFFPIGTQLCGAGGTTPACATMLPATGSLSPGQVLKGVQADNLISTQGCKGEVNGLPASITCVDTIGNVLTGGGTSSVGVVCPKGNWAGGNNGNISSKPPNHGFDLFGDSDCVLDQIIKLSVELNGVPNDRCQTQQGGNRIRCFFDEGAVYTASGCTPGKKINLVATGEIVVPQGNGTVTVPFYTDPGDPVTCKKQ